MTLKEIENIYFKNKQLNDETLEMYKKIEDIDFLDSDNLSALLLACKYADFKAIEYLISKDVDVNITNPYLATPLITLAKSINKYGYIPAKGDIYKSAILLLEAKSSTLKKDESGKTCYFIASENGCHELLQALCEKGIKMKATHEEGNNSLHIIAKRMRNLISDLDRAKSSLERETNNNPNSSRITFYKEDIEKQNSYIQDYLLCAKWLIESGLDVDEKNIFSQTAKDIAVNNNAVKLVSLISGNLDLNDNTDSNALSGMSLHDAVYSKNIDEIKKLKDAGADFNEISDEEKYKNLTPLMLAVRSLNFDIIKTLIECGSDVNIKNNTEQCAINFIFTQTVDMHYNQDLAKNKILENIIKLFIANGFKIDSIIDSQENTLLLLACSSNFGSSGYPKNIKEIVINECLKNKCNIDATNKNAQTALMCAFNLNIGITDNIITSLLENGADLSKKDILGNTALLYLCASNNNQKATEYAEMMFDVGNPIADTINNNGDTALSIATKRNNESLVKLLLENM